MATTNVPIWRDQYQALGNVASRSYVIKLGADTVYAGTAWRRPGESQPQVLINDIAAPYLKQNADCLQTEEGDDYYAADIIKTFKVQDTGGTQYGDDFDCFLKWEEDSRNVLGTSGAHAPITARICDGMPLILTAYNANVLTHDGGSATYVRLRCSTDPTASNVIAWQGAGNYTVQVSFVPADTWVRINGFQYDRVEGCTPQYALYYVNAYGAWDFLVCEGAAREGRRYERHTLKKVHNNGSEKSRGIWNYANEVRRTWTLNTGWLSDDQAARMHHLIGSTLVYLYDIAAQTFRPVNVTDGEVTARKYEQEGAPINYTINVEEGREGLRR